MRSARMFLVSVFIAEGALAQSGPPPPPPPPPPAEAPPPPPPLEPAPEAAEAAPQKDLSNESRLRWGVNAQLGWFHPVPMFTYGLEGRIGWSVNKLFAAYFQLGAGSGLFFGLSGGSGGGSLSISVMSQWYAGALAELNVGDLFFIAAGPAIGRFSLAGVTLSATTSGQANEQISAMGGWTPSIDLRLGFGFGKRNPESGRRGGFTLALDLRAVFPTDSVFVRLGTGGTAIETRRTGFGLLPMLMLGYDSR